MDSATKVIAFCFLLWCIFMSSWGTIINRFAELDSLIKSGNLSHPPWFYTGKPLNVTLDIHLSELRDVDPERLEIELGYFRHLKWLDERLKYNKKLTKLRKYIPWEPAFKKTVWTTDIHATNAAVSRYHLVPDGNMIYRLYPDGTIYESVLISSTLICKKAPIYPKIEFDCVLRFESYGYSKEELTIDWKAKYAQGRTDFFSAPTFKLKNIRLNETCHDTRNIGTYDCIELSMIVYQEYQPYVTEIFVPSSLIVMAAWMTFWVDKNSVPARVSLGGLCVIASITHSVGLVLGLRHNIEWNSVNIWLNTCIIFVIAALLEYGIVHSLARRANKAAQSGSSRSSSESSSSDQDHTECFKGQSRGNRYSALQDVTGDSYGVENESSKPAVSRSCVSRFRRVIRKLKTNPGKIDTIMRVLYPVVFATFVICYWIHFTRTG